MPWGTSTSSLIGAVLMLVVTLEVTQMDAKRRNKWHRPKTHEITAKTNRDYLNSETNMLLNPSFEEEFPDRKSGEVNPWQGGSNFFHTRVTNVVRKGRYSLLVSQRKSHLNGAVQALKGLKPGRGYAVSGFVKLNDDVPGKLWQHVRVSLKFHFTDSPDKPEYVMMGAHDNEVVPEAEATSCIRTGDGQKEKAYLKPDRSRELSYTMCHRAFLRASDGWMELYGDINAPMREFQDEVMFKIYGPDQRLDFYLDDLKLVEIPEHPDWMAAALEETHRRRTSSFNLKFSLPKGTDPKDFDVEVKLKHLDFAVGVKVEDDCIRQKSRAAKYNEFVFKLFNWAAVGSYKWSFQHGTEKNPDYSNAVEATDVLLEHGLKVRAHSILWDVADNVPPWVKNVPCNAALRNMVYGHVRYMVNLTRGRVKQWDVQNEMISGHYYEECLQDPMFTVDVFKLVRSLDKNVCLFLNDFQAVTTGGQTTELINLVRKFRTHGAVVHGVGIQGHTKEYIKPDPQMIWHRLNEFGKLKALDVFVTEFDVGHMDDVIRADYLEDALRAFFAHPVLKGVILWGFWNKRMRYENKYLAYGDRFKLAEPGTRFACLVEKEWTTRHTFRLSKYTSLNVNLSGYHGDYDVIIRRNGKPIQLRSLKIKGPKTFVIKVMDRTEAIQIANDTDYMSECVSHRDQKTLGSVVSPAGSKDKNGICVTRKRTQKVGVMDEIQDGVTVTCEGEEVLTDCNSVVGEGSKNFDPVKARLGEEITFVDGHPACSAYVRQGTPEDAPVTAEARCCVITGLRCDYRRAGPSLLMEDAMAEASCLKRSLALGCAAYNAMSLLKGMVFRGETPRSCVGKSGVPASSVPKNKSGVMTSAACCKRTGMTCRVVKSDRSSVSCPPDKRYVMTGCAAEGFSFGAQIREKSGQDICVVRSHPGVAVTPLATCCIFS